MNVIELMKLEYYECYMTFVKIKSKKYEVNYYNHDLRCTYFAINYDNMMMILNRKSDGCYYIVYQDVIEQIYSKDIIEGDYLYDICYKILG
jgi:GTP cyclohydrolase III